VTNFSADKTLMFVVKQSLDHRLQ